MGATSSKQSTGLTVGVIIGCLVLFLVAIFFAVRLIQKRMSPFMDGLKPSPSQNILPISSIDHQSTSPPLYDSAAFASAGDSEGPKLVGGVRRRGEGEQAWTDGPELLYTSATGRGDESSLETMEVK